MSVKNSPFKLIVTDKLVTKEYSIYQFAAAPKKETQPELERIQVRVIVFCKSFAGELDMHHCVVECTQIQFQDDEHLDAAIRDTEHLLYDAEKIAADEHNMPEWLLARFNWKDVRRIVC